MLKLGKPIQQKLLEIYAEDEICLEGNILKIIDSEGNTEFEEYIKTASEQDKSIRRKRLEVTKQIQSKNKELETAHKENVRVNRQLNKALEEAEKLKMEAIASKDAALVSRDEAQTERDRAELLMTEAHEARIVAEVATKAAETAKQSAENDLELIQKKTQNELIGIIVKVALWVILGVGITTTAVYLISMVSGRDTAVIASTWSNIIGILLTNSFSIIGTIMGVKYASEKNKE